MSTFKSELNAIIGQIRSGNNDPELLADALQVIADNPPFFERGYSELKFSFRGNGSVGNPVLDLTIINNTLGVTIETANQTLSGFYFEFSGGLFDSGANSLTEVFAVVPSDEGGVAYCFLDGAELTVNNTLSSPYTYGDAPAVVTIRQYNNQP